MSSHLGRHVPNSPEFEARRTRLSRPQFVRSKARTGIGTSTVEQAWFMSSIRRTVVHYARRLTFTRLRRVQLSDIRRVSSLLVGQSYQPMSLWTLTVNEMYAVLRNSLLAAVEQLGHGGWLVRNSGHVPACMEPGRFWPGDFAPLKQARARAERR